MIFIYYRFNYIIFFYVIYCILFLKTCLYIYIREREEKNISMPQYIHVYVYLYMRERERRKKNISMPQYTRVCIYIYICTYVGNAREREIEDIDASI